MSGPRALPFLRIANLQTSFACRRKFSTTIRRLEIAAAPPPAPPPRKPVGAFRGGLTGFLLGSVLAGGASYTYVLNEYRVSNELLTEDIYNLQATVQRIEGYVRVLEGKLAEKK